MRPRQLLAVLACGALLPSEAGVAEGTKGSVTLCGWFENPTPANVSLIDRSGEWIIGVQGGHQADGDWPVFKPSQWVRTNGNYGYGCACISGEVDAEAREVLSIRSAKAKPLSACRKDRALKKPAS